MKKVITYGTYDLLHYGHIRLLERAKALGDYLIVGVTSEDFDKKRGKINVKQSLMERVEAVKATGLADEVIVEEYEGQKIDDIKRYNIDIFTVGSDWKGKFDYLKEYCDVVYLDRTEGISSSQLRSLNSAVRLGFVGSGRLVEKYIKESKYVNGIQMVSICTSDMKDNNYYKLKKYPYNRYEDFLANVDAVCIVSSPELHFDHISTALKNGKHVICDSPISLNKKQCSYLFNLAKEKNLILMDAVKTAYSTAFNRLTLLVKSGLIGDIVSIDTTCTSMSEYLKKDKKSLLKGTNSLCYWGPTALIPIFTLLGTNYKNLHFNTYYLDKKRNFDLFTKVDFIYKNAVASIKVGKGVKSEGELVITGTKGYVYVPAPWWKMDYFEIKYENSNDNKRYFYQLDGEGIRYELLTFIKSIENKSQYSYISRDVSENISLVIEKFYSQENMDELIIEN